MGRQPRPPDLRVTSTGLPLQVCELRAGGLRIGWWCVVGGRTSATSTTHCQPLTT